MGLIYKGGVMEINAENLKDPVFSDFDNKSIDVKMNHPMFGWIDYTSKKDDADELSRTVFGIAARGDLGPIAPYSGPSRAEILSREMREKRDFLLLSVDKVATNPLRYSELNEAQQQELAKYRKGLLDVPQQADFPDSIDWPVPPIFLKA